jgi:hypothetical protein
MVSAMADAPADASALELIAAALDAAAAQFEPVSKFAIPRHRIIVASPELQERELIKLASLTTALTRALRARGFASVGAALAANMTVALMHVAFEQWVGIWRWAFRPSTMATMPTGNSQIPTIPQTSAAIAS